MASITRFIGLDIPAAKVFAAGISALVVSVGIARFAFTPLFPVMVREAGLNDIGGGWLAAVNYVGYLMGALFVAATRSPQAKLQFYRLSLIGALVTTAAMGLTENFLIWIVLRLIGGIASAAGMLVASGFILSWLASEKRKPRLGLHFTGMGLGVTICGVAAIAMSGKLDWSKQWIVFALIEALFLLPAWLWLPVPSSASKAMKGRISPRTRRWLLLFVGTYFCAGVGYVISATFIVASVERLPVFLGWGGLIWVLVGLAAIPSCFAWDRLASSWGDTNAIIAAFWVQIVSILLALSDNAGANIVGAILYGGTFVGIVNLALSMVGRRLSENPSSAMAKLTISYSLAQILMPTIAGYTAHATKSYDPVMLMAAGIMIVGAIMLMFLPRFDPLQQRALEPEHELQGSA